ncbi:unnamed protein product [Symbiodinium pilosum]|uniref:Uncharacterized protein n=1 Tax=Symbiodinium pilosum TaxID=2952 RepID=A0A812XE91_SYMPI|nr:unnamed protein product [Symbiodinium pilosum]
MNGALVADKKNPMDPSRQVQVHSDIQKARSVQDKAKGHFKMPSPRDCKATMLQGSGVVQVTDGSPRKGHGSPKKASTVHFFIENDERPVQANRVDLKTENEYWTQSSNMSSLDTRGELIRHKEARDSWTQLSCNARKQRDLQSKVLGGSSQTSTAAPRLLAGAGLSPRNSSLRLPLSPREHKANEIATSEESPLSMGKPVRPSKSMSPRSSIAAFRDSTNDAFRRSNSQFTDLRSCEMPLSARSPRRSEMQDMSTTYWANSTTEISRKNAQRHQRRGGQENEVMETAGLLIHQSSPRLAAESAHDKKLWQDERVCGGAASGMQASLEISRRRRELQTSKSMGELPSRALSASERKRVDLASGQIRLAAGIPLQKHDDGSPSGWASPRSMRATVTQPPCAKTAVRGVMNQPSMSKFRNMEPDSPQARKVREQRTSFALL